MNLKENVLCKQPKHRKRSGNGKITATCPPAPRTQPPPTLVKYTPRSFHTDLEGPVGYQNAVLTLVGD
ncbi:hypothetical protein VN97_g8490 [Penicillium thymicola]|uniref:Uncharacterized protein n=1 Tax=Penicillium thymicola TaxID=293382 RepID=A0AAI9TDC3_PENTH|nr:hypothetical protein VN97_g8490 [Penicillium thymicola]